MVKGKGFSQLLSGPLRAAVGGHGDIATQRISIDDGAYFKERVNIQRKASKKEVVRAGPLPNELPLPFVERLNLRPDWRPVVNGAKDAIDANLTLDSDKSSLSRLKRELVTILDRHEKKVESFQTSVQAALEAMKAQRQEASRSTTHGGDFEDAVAEVVDREAQKGSDIASRTGKTTGCIRSCKVGDLVVELGAECAAAGDRFVVEAKEDKSYTLATARAKIEMGRKNRNASVGLFVFSEKTAPKELDKFTRLGEDVFVVWDAERIESDVILKAGFSLAKALRVRQAQEGQAEDGNWDNMDAAILALEQEAKRLTKMKTLTETIQTNSGKVLDEVRKMTEGVERQTAVMRESVAALKVT